MFVFAALGAGLLFAAGVVFQQKAAATDGASIALVRNPLWLFGIGCDLGGFLLQILALYLGSVVGVQALLTSSLPFGLLLARQRPSREGMAGVACVVAGLAGLLLAADPQRGHHPQSLVLAVVVVGAVAAVLTAFALTHKAFAAIGRALAAGLLFSLTAVSAEGFGDRLAQGGFIHAFTHIEPYIIAVSSGIGLLLSQQAYASGPLGPTLAALTLIDPLSSLGLGITVTGDMLRGGGWGVLAGFCALLAAVGVVLLARARAHAEQVAARIPASAASR